MAELKDASANVSDALPVVLTKPKRSLKDLGWKVVGEISAFFIEIWLFMLVLGGIHSYYPQFIHPAYWATALILLAFNYAFQLGKRDKINLFLKDD